MNKVNKCSSECPITVPVTQLRTRTGLEKWCGGVIGNPSLHVGCDFTHSEKMIQYLTIINVIALRFLYMLLLDINLYSIIKRHPTRIIPIIYSKFNFSVPRLPFVLQKLKRNHLRGHKTLVRQDHITTKCFFLAPNNYVISITDVPYIASSFYEALKYWLNWEIILVLCNLPCAMCAMFQIFIHSINNGYFRLNLSAFFLRPVSRVFFAILSLSEWNTRE